MEKWKKQRENGKISNMKEYREYTEIWIFMEYSVVVNSGSKKWVSVWIKCDLKFTSELVVKKHFETIIQK